MIYLRSRSLYLCHASVSDPPPPSPFPNHNSPFPNVSKHSQAQPYLVTHNLLSPQSPQDENPHYVTDHPPSSSHSPPSSHYSHYTVCDVLSPFLSPALITAY